MSILQTSIFVIVMVPITVCLGITNSRFAYQRIATHLFGRTALGPRWITPRRVNGPLRAATGNISTTITDAVTTNINSKELAAPEPMERYRKDTSTVVANAPSLVQTTSTNTTVILADNYQFVRPLRDPRHYRCIRLSNNLEVLLVSDQLAMGEVGTEAASVHVKAGHMDDSIRGLAHFHEHMLFLGTKKYPDEDSYETFLSQFGGFSNAYTDMEDTNYYFAVTTEVEENNNDTTTEALTGGLDRLAQFFIAPTFDRDMVDREIRAIDSEYRMSRTSDNWRNFQLLKTSCDPRHPFAKFGCGTYETLTEEGLDILLQELRKFWDTYYQTYNLRLAVVGHASLDALQRTVEDTFGQLRSSNGLPRHSQQVPGQVFPRENAVYNASAYSPEQLGVVWNVIPFTEARVLKVYFATPPLSDPVVDKSKPYQVISHILGHESPGSLHALLNEAGYLSALTAGSSIDVSDFSLYSITMALTPKGMKERQKVLDLLFQWIALLRDNVDALPSYHDELRRIAEFSFRFRENGDPTDFCSSASELLFDDGTDPSKILFQASDLSHFDPIVVRAFLDRLRPDNCIVMVTNSDFNESIGEWSTEPWYGARYQVEKLSSEQRQALENPTTRDAQLRLPALNKYIPTDFTLRCDDESNKHEENEKVDVKEPPKLLIDRPNLRLWHKMDRWWRVPKAAVRLALLSPKIYSSPRSMTLSRIFQRVLNDDLNSFVYDASVAGCNYRVTCTPSGYRVSVRGYSEKIPFLLDTLTSRMLSLLDEMKAGNLVLQSKFDKAKENLLRETKNYRLDAPHEVNNYNSRLLLEENVWYLDNYISEMEGPEAEENLLTMQECSDLARECLTGRVKCECLCMGNVDEKGALHVAHVIDRHFLAKSRTLSEAEAPRFRSLKIPTRHEAEVIFGPTIQQRTIPLVYQDLAFSETEENNAVEIVLQVGCELDLGYEGMALLELVSHIAYNSAFNQLRTKEQLGYIVSVFARKTAGSSWGLSVVVQSSSALPDVLEKRCEAWLALFRSELEKMSPASIAQEASAVASQLLESETKLSQEVSRIWGEILNTEWLTNQLRTPTFSRIAKLAEQLSVEPLIEASGGRQKSPEALKKKLLSFFDTYLATGSAQRRALSCRVYSHGSKKEYEASLNEVGVLSSLSDVRTIKQFLSSWPTAPYWRTGMEEKAGSYNE